MTATNSLSTFHHWLLAEPGNTTSARAIILHGNSADFNDHLIDEIANYLNEYDDDGAGKWLSVTSDLAEQISADQNLRTLLGVPENCPDCQPSDSCEIRKILTAIGQRGHVIFRTVPPPSKDLEVPGAFHAGIGIRFGTAVKCHIVLNPDLLNPESIAHIIGDVFLEWLNHDRHPAPAAH